MQNVVFHVYDKQCSHNETNNKPKNAQRRHGRQHLHSKFTVATMFCSVGIMPDGCLEMSTCSDAICTRGKYKESRSGVSGEKTGEQLALPTNPLAFIKPFLRPGSTTKINFPLGFHRAKGGASSSRESEHAKGLAFRLLPKPA